MATNHRNGPSPKRRRSLLHRVRSFANDLRMRLWFRPLMYCAIAMLLLGGAAFSDRYALPAFVPTIAAATTEKLLTVLSTTLLAVATFAVSSMLAAYSVSTSISSPRTFKLVLADDISQSALSSFIGAFIFSVLGLIPLTSGVFGPTGEFALFCLTVLLFVWVVATFVRWVDRIARLGRMGSTLSKTEAAARGALAVWADSPALGGVPISAQAARVGHAVRNVAHTGFVRSIDMAHLQALAKSGGARLSVSALPGDFVWPSVTLIHVTEGETPNETALAACFEIGAERSFNCDPRFGLTVLAEIASRALSPGINDPGTAIGVLCTLHRLFWVWGAKTRASGPETPTHDRVAVPPLDVNEMFEAAFAPIARDGAGMLEVGVQFQTTCAALQTLGHPAITAAARHQAKLALSRSALVLNLPGELARLKKIAGMTAD